VGNARSPGFGSDAQDVINKQMLNQIGVPDIFIGVMWTRFGTPTHRAESGTQEEFQIAHNCLSSIGRPRILMYFKTAAFFPKTIDEVEQLRKVIEFKKSLSEGGGLLWEFDTTQHFLNYVREHLISEVNQYTLPATPNHDAPKGGTASATPQPESFRVPDPLSDEVFPRGLRLLEFEPGKLFVVKSIDPYSPWDSLVPVGILLFLPVGIWITPYLTGQAKTILIYVLFGGLVFTLWYFSGRLGKRVTLDLHRLRSWVSEFPAFSRGGLPPKIAHVTRYDYVRNKHVTTVSIDGVPIIRRKSDTPSGGIEELAPFIAALESIAAKRRPRADNSASKIEGK
jgi:hypothetical protein